jgi:hypothetical protein
LISKKYFSLKPLCQMNQNLVGSILAKDASYQISIHLTKRFQRKRFKKIGQSETRIAYGGQICTQIGTK